MMFITYICIFSYKLPSHIHTFGLLLILSRFIGRPRYSYHPKNHVRLATGTALIKLKVILTLNLACLIVLLNPFFLECHFWGLELTVSWIDHSTSQCQVASIRSYHHHSHSHRRCERPDQQHSFARCLYYRPRL